MSKQSPNRTLINTLSTRAGEKVLLRGWLNNIRSLGKISFLILRDRTGFAQVVIEDKSLAKEMNTLQPGSILSISGVVRETPEALGGVEIGDPEIQVESPVTDIPPLEYYREDIPADLDFILDNRSVALRNRKLQAVFRVQAEIVHAYRLYMHDVVGAYEYFGPNIIGASSEGGAEFFTVDYFGHTATLAQSSQLYKQIMVGVNERVFAIMPFFRAENSNTSRHLTEGKQLEFEMGFFDHWHEVMDVEEGFFKYLMKYLQESCAVEIETLGIELVKAPEDVSFPRVTFQEAQEIYFQRTGVDERSEPDFSPAAERELSQYALEECGTDFIFVTDWLKEKRPFYSYVNDENPELTNTFDLLCAGQELTSGGQRCHTYQSMVDGIVGKEMDPENFTDYLDIFRYGMPPHGGFGLGLERLTMAILKLQNVREASLFPSDPKRIAGNRIKRNIVFGGENLRNEIIKDLKRTDAEFEHLVHEETPTSEDSARVRGTTLEQGVKSIILRGKKTKNNYHVNVPSHLKLDMKSVSDTVGEKCEFEKPEVIDERFGLQTGSVPPFGNLLGLPTYFDQRIIEQETVAFNCGLRTESIKMKSSDLVTLIDPETGVFGKE